MPRYLLETEAEYGKYLTRITRTSCICDTDSRPDLSLYRRAHVNLLIASVVDVQEHMDAAKYAQECIDLNNEVKAQGFANNVGYLDNLAIKAAAVKSEIEGEVAAMQQQTMHIGAAAGGRLDSAGLGANMIRKLVEDFGSWSFKKASISAC